MEHYQDINAATIDRWVEEGWEWGKPISHQEYLDALEGKWEMLLTPTKPVPKAWFGGPLKGKRVLGLASGGGQQMPIFAALGAVCTVLDYSPRQLESERMVAQREGYEMQVVRGNMTKPLPFADGAFDLIFHPVSNCYVQEVKPIFKECFRVLAPGGILLSGLDNGINFLFVDEDKREELSVFPFDPVKNPEQRRQLEAEGDGMQFSHTMEEQIGGQLEAGFRLVALYEDTNGAGTFHEHHIPCYLATQAVKEG
ncbi:class I SAM-dependent methyltransferase [Acutalibacter caecimuris]|uniref:class I SAM-dependent methyltransferase n=1 Tax=Acutalibacter caecimuris TaxID=3093657 RepID=UPI002AC99E10|nr:methyltransferase domain-containing protein [Acutalibacter sp. M00118]